MTKEPFDCLWDFIASQESGELSTDPADRGNWTSGIVGVGKLVGSKFGVSAAAFPNVDIPSMSFEGARDVCRDHYLLNPLTRADLLPASFMILVVDASWGSGPIPAGKALQTSLGLRGNDVDGEIGNKTRSALTALMRRPPLYPLPTSLDVLLAEFAAERVLFESAAGTWERYKGGWVRRITRSLTLARSFVDADCASLNASLAASAASAAGDIPAKG